MIVIVIAAWHNVFPFQFINKLRDILQTLKFRIYEPMFTQEIENVNYDIVNDIMLDYSKITYSNTQYIELYNRILENKEVVKELDIRINNYRQYKD